MKSFHLTVWGILLLFTLVMGSVVSVAFRRPSNRYKIDASQIGKIREMARR